MTQQKAFTGIGFASFSWWCFFLVVSSFHILSSIVRDLLKEVRGEIGCLYNLSEIISTLDMLMSFAHTRTTTDCGM